MKYTTKDEVIQRNHKQTVVVYFEQRMKIKGKENITESTEY